ncbi:hypothetical protein [Arthrobacter sp. B0490]|uniref:hypothetical protein n=1 Tax=Arthrobacter sp. B0490 TaxID=2058891 RepID=UPI0011B044A3|nr:hypothetical protein [Arthrobacter sp. B0490]
MPTPTDDITSTGTPTPSTTTFPSSSTSPPAESSPLSEVKRLRLGLYTDEWARNIGNTLRGHADSIRGTGEPVPLGRLQQALEYSVANVKPEGFEIPFETTESDNYTIKVFHPDAYAYNTEATAYTIRSDRALPTSIATTPPPEEETTPLGEIDFETTKMLYRTASTINTYMSENNGAVPTDEYLRDKGDVLEGWAWSIDQSPTAPDQRIIRVWNPGGEVYNSKDNAAYFDSFPKEDYRPQYNFNTGFTVLPSAPDQNAGPTSTPTPIPTEE